MNDITTMFTDLFSNAPISYILGIVLVVIFIFKKLIKWAIVSAVLMFFVLPYLDEQGYLDPIKGIFS
jgi:hypothetical protein